jgi:hydroxyacyl-ACP dehydratase HTD2-like protein with hotdog domain
MSGGRIQRYADHVQVGDELPELVKLPTAVQLFRYSAVTWNAHRIHFEPAYARKEGHPDILVQAHLHGAFLAQLVMDWGGPKCRMVKFGWRNRGRAVPGDVLRCTGRVTGKYQDGHRHLIEIELLETLQRSETAAEGNATISLPSMGDGH